MSCETGGTGEAGIEAGVKRGAVCVGAMRQALEYKEIQRNTRGRDEKEEF